MPQKKKQFRFKIPWISGSRAPPHATESQSRGPKQRSESPVKPDTKVPNQRPPFRPPGIAPAPPLHSPPTQVQGTSRAEPQQQPPSRPPQSPTSSVIVGSPLSSPSESPSRPSTPTRVNSPLSSPSRTTQTQDLLLSPSPSPSHAGSPSHLPSGHSMEVPPQPASAESTHPPPSASEQESEKMESPLNTLTKSPESETSSQPERMSTQPTGSPISKTPVPSQSQQSPSHHGKGSEQNMMSPLKGIPKELELETQSKTHQPHEAKEIVVLEHEPIKVGKGNANDIKHGESIQRSKPEFHTPAPAASGVQTKDVSTRGFRADRKQKEAREFVERKMMFATSSSSTGKDIKIVNSADPATRNVSSTSIPSEKSPQSNEEKQHIPLQKGIKDDISNFVQKLATVTPTQPMDDNNFSVVTLAGDNRGATMHVGSNSTKKEESIRIHRAYKTDPEESTEATTDADENSPRSSAEKDEVPKAYVNSNIQSVNNSLMLHGSVSERDPGVRVVLPQQQAEPIKPLETRRVEVNVNRAEKLSYPRPVVRRRCLRGLFLEPSDSDPDNPDKPRRHGCKFRCGDKGSEIM